MVIPFKIYAFSVLSFCFTKNIYKTVYDVNNLLSKLNKMTTIIISIFIAGYVAITTEHTTKIIKAASALLTGVL